MLVARALLLGWQRSSFEAAEFAWRLHWRHYQCQRELSTCSNPAWVLVQCEGSSSTRAVGGSTGLVHLERQCNDDIDSPGSGSSSPAAGRLSLGRLRQALLSQLTATFLPAGYPDTVAPGYLRNTLWQAAHHTAGSANGVLASTFLLYSVGLGAGAVPTAGALNWVLKDGLGQLGTLLFGKTIAHNFDVSPRIWYLLASAKLNLAMGLEICTFLVPAYFLPVGALANAIKGLSWMAGGSTKSVFKVSFAADNNFGDVSAKATSQTICASVLGTSAGVALASQVGQSVGLALACYASLAAFHLYTGYLAVQCVPLATLNPSRLELLVRLYLQQVQAQQQAQQQQQQQQQEQGQQPSHKQQPQQEQQQQRASVVELPTPAELAAQDPVFHRPSVCIGTPLRKLVKQHGAQLGLYMTVVQQQEQQSQAQPGKQLEEQEQEHKQHWHAHSIKEQQQQHEQQQQERAGTASPSRHFLVPTGEHVHLLLHERAEAADCILGFLHACLVLWGPSGSGTCGSNHTEGSSTRSATSSSDAGSMQSRQTVDSEQSGQAADRVQSNLGEAWRLLPGLLAALEAAGWDDQKVVLEAKRRRCKW